MEKEGGAKGRGAGREETKKERWGNGKREEPPNWNFWLRHWLQRIF